MGIDLRSWVRDVPDFPKPGILFRDVTPLLAHPPAFRFAIDELVRPFANGGVDRVIGIESRGFFLGGPAALDLDAGLVIARKDGRLPAETHRVEYDLEYGSDAVEIHVDAIEPGQRVLVVDDLMATGGTAAAAAELARRSGGEVVGCAFLIELEALGGRAKLDVPEIHSLLRY